MIEPIARSADAKKWLLVFNGTTAQVLDIEGQTLSEAVDNNTAVDLVRNEGWVVTAELPDDVTALAKMMTAMPGDDTKEEEPDDDEAEIVINVEEGDDTDEETKPKSFKLMFLNEKSRTDDGRSFTPNGIGFREPPLPVMFTTVNAGPGKGHAGSKLGGTITEVFRVGTKLWGKGNFLDTPDGQEFQHLVETKGLTGVSADVADAKTEISLGEDGGQKQHIHSGKIIGATALPFPAFGDTRISILDAATAAAYITASATETAPCNLCAPPREWFEDPKLTKATPLTITADGRIFGHVAPWGVCHTGFPNTCLTAPRNHSGYAFFRTGHVLCADGSEVATGPITLGIGHAGLQLGADKAKAHYDDVNYGVADVAAGDDDHGIWIAGRIRPDVTEERLNVLRASAPSGDWRRIGTNLEMVAVLAVNHPGFPVIRASAELENDVVLALVAAGVGDIPTSLESRLAVVEQRLGVKPEDDVVAFKGIGQWHAEATKAQGTAPDDDTEELSDEERAELEARLVQVEEAIVALAFGGKKAAPFKKGGGRDDSHPNDAKGEPRNDKERIEAAEAAIIALGEGLTPAPV